MHNLIPLSDFVTKYARLMYKRNLWSFGNSCSIDDIINETYSIGFNSYEEAIKIVRDIVFKEKRRLIVVRQQLNQNFTGEKTCNRCKESKLFSEFYNRFDKRNGFRYFSNNCKSCETKRRFEYNSRKRTEKNTNHNEKITTN